MSTLSAPAAAAPAVGAGPSTARLAGLAGLAFAVGVVAANALLFGMPTPDVAVADAAAWYEANRMRAMLASAMVALTFPALLIFGAAMFELGRGEVTSRRWMLVGALGGVAMVGVFSLVAAGQIASVLLVATGGDAFAVAWTLHNAAFAVNMSVLGTAFLGFALGAHAAGLIPGGLRTLGVIGAALLLVTGFANAAVADGSPAAFVGLGGFLLWLVWLVATSIRLMRIP